jgi:excisionase family DNA binding protein
VTATSTWLTPAELAKLLRTSKSNVNRMAAEGIIPALALGTGDRRHEYRFRSDEVLSALAERQNRNRRLLR